MKKRTTSRCPFSFLLIKRLFLCGCRGKHELDSVFLIDLCCTGVVIDGNNICLWVSLLDGTGHTLCHNVIRQAAERLGADDVFNAMFNQHCHFSGDHPAFAHTDALIGIFVRRFPQFFKVMHGRKYAMLLHTTDGFHLLAV